MTRNTEKAPAINGILNIDKPKDLTSMDVVRRIKRASKQKRVGHGGTLDPIATGVIPICMGQATRMMEYVVDGSKEYRGTVEMGVETDTYDAMGEAVRRADTSGVTAYRIEGALDSFEGEVMQVPPMYSALKIKGKRLYDLARAGIEVEREARPVKVHDVKLLDYTPPHAVVEVSCGRGFYMRSLAHDLGQALGCGGHLKELVRLRSGPFSVSEAASLEEAEERFLSGDWSGLVHAPDAVVQHLKAITVEKPVEAMIRQGRPVPTGAGVPAPEPEERRRAYGADGRFMGILAYNASEAHLAAGESIRGGGLGLGIRVVRLRIRQSLVLPRALPRPHTPLASARTRFLCGSATLPQSTRTESPCWRLSAALYSSATSGMGYPERAA